jgi:protein SCO1
VRRAALLAAALLTLACAGAATAASTAGDPPVAQHQPDAKHETKHEHSSPAAPDKPAPVGAQPGAKPPLPSNPATGVTERIGRMAALDVELFAEDGTRLILRDLVDKPTLIAPVYYSCPNECNVLLGTLSSVLPQVGLKPGVDYQVLAVSFDDRDTPPTATKRKGDFFNAGLSTGLAGFPPMAWSFLTGDEQNVRKLMDSLGFGYQRTGDTFQHSIALIVLTPSGKISRYLYGIRPLAFDIALAATEAGAEKTGLSVKRAISMCYTYDPEGRRYVFDFVKVAGAGVLVAIGIFGLFLAFGGKKRGPRPPENT